MNYQRIQKLPRMVQTGLNKAQSARPKKAPGTSVNYERQQTIDVVRLHEMNRAAAKKPESQARMDRQDRLLYIREQKAKLGLSNNVLLRSSKRTFFDGELHKELPSLDFNGLHTHHTESNLF